MSEKQLADLIRQDTIGKPAPQVENQLNYVFMLKSVKSKARQNSFSGFLGWIFSMDGMGVKAVVASVLFLFFMIKPELNRHPGSDGTADSTSIQQSVVIDSTLFQPDSKIINDSIF